MHDTPLGWTMYLEELERQAIRLRRRPEPPRRARIGVVAAILGRLRPMRPMAARLARSAVDSGPGRG
jgi:hypothetical protein